MSETETKLREATQPRYVLEIGLIKLVEMRRVTPIEKLLERLAKLEDSIGNGNLQTENFDVNTISKHSTEKKTLKTDFPLEEVPFPVKSAIFRLCVAKMMKQFTPSIKLKLSKMLKFSGRERIDLSAEILRINLR